MMVCCCDAVKLLHCYVTKLICLHAMHCFTCGTDSCRASLSIIAANACRSVANMLLSCTLTGQLLLHVRVARSLYETGNLAVEYACCHDTSHGLYTALDDMALP